MHDNYKRQVSFFEVLAVAAAAAILAFLIITLMNLVFAYFASRAVNEPFCVDGMRACLAQVYP